jgi:hypothetical protein
MPQFLAQDMTGRGKGLPRVAMGPAQGLRDNGVNKPKIFQMLGGDF